MTKIEVVISPTGETRITTLGYSGSDCQTASRFLENALGIREKETLTSEFHTSAQQQSQTEEGI